MLNENFKTELVDLEDRIIAAINGRVLGTEPNILRAPVFFKDLGSGDHVYVYSVQKDIAHVGDTPEGPRHLVTLKALHVDMLITVLKDFEDAL